MAWLKVEVNARFSAECRFDAWSMPAILYSNHARGLICSIDAGEANRRLASRL